MPVEPGPFNVRFQLHFLSFMLRDTEFLSRVAEDITQDFFTNEYLQKIVRLILSFYSLHKTAPSEMLFQELDDWKSQGLISEDTHKVISRHIDELFSYKLQNRDYFLSQIDDFLWHQNVMSKLVLLPDLLKKRDRKTVEDLLKALIIPNKTEERFGSDYTANAQSRVARRQLDNPDLLYCCIPELDEQCPPLKRGQIFLWQSRESSDGKTAALVHNAKAALFQNKKVMICTLEESIEEYEDKLDMCLAGIRRDELTDAEKIERQTSRYLNRGDLHIAEFPPGVTTVEMLQNYCKKRRATHNFIPDVILLDYADKLYCGDSQMQRDTSRAGEKIFLDFERWAKEDNFFAFTATQSGRQAGQKQTADQGDVGGSLKKIHIAHRVISINRDPDNDKVGLVTLKLIKNRGGVRGGTVLIQTDYAKYCFWVNRKD